MGEEEQTHGSGCVVLVHIFLFVRAQGEASAVQKKRRFQVSPRLCGQGASQLQQQQAPLTPNRKAEIQHSATTPLRAADCSMPAAFASAALLNKHKPQLAAHSAACVRASPASQARRVPGRLCASLKGTNRSLTPTCSHHPGTHRRTCQQPALEAFWLAAADKQITTPLT